MDVEIMRKCFITYTLGLFCTFCSKYKLYALTTFSFHNSTIELRNIIILARSALLIARYVLVKVMSTFCANTII